MRKNSPRKWLHACLDLLPVILIPVFMIYSHRHTIDSGTIDVPQNQVVDFNQQFELNDFTTNGYGSITYNDDNVLIVTPDSVNNGAWRIEYPINLISHQYLIKYSYLCAFATSNQLITNVGTLQTYANVSNVQYDLSLVFNGEDVNVIRFYYDTSISLTGGVSVYFKYLQLFDLTQMFGSGNEPTAQQFDAWYTQDYYDYTLSHKELLKNTSTITYSDTDIMSQFTYQLYNSVDKYFNMGNVFNMTSVYDWFNLNIFNGNAPISIYIIWNIVLYEFVMDLLFLLYGLFMWFIDIVQHIMDKPFKSIK